MVSRDAAHTVDLTGEHVRFSYIEQPVGENLTLSYMFQSAILIVLFLIVGVLRFMWKLSYSSTSL